MGIYISDIEMPIAEAYELPSYGRMVDLDKILKDLYTNYRYALTRSVLDRLEASQIIIPADPVEED